MRIILKMIIVSLFCVFAASLPSSGFAGDKENAKPKRYAKRGEGVMISGNRSSLLITKRKEAIIYTFLESYSSIGGLIGKEKRG